MQRYRDVFRVSSFLLLVPYTYSIVCLDINGNCDYWVKHDECLHNPSYVITQCPLSCNMATTCGNTTDIDDGCWSKAASGRCEKSKDFRENLCNTTCSIRAKVKCVPPPSYPLTTHNSKTTYRFLDRVKYKCITGYHNTKASNVGQKTCSQTGTWLVRQLIRGDLPICKPITCGNPPILNNTEIEYNGTLYTDRVFYGCSVGFSRTSGDIERFCQADKSWNGSDLVCHAILSTLDIDTTPSIVTFETDSTISPSAVVHNPKSTELLSSDMLIYSSYSESVRDTLYEQIQDQSSWNSWLNPIYSNGFRTILPNSQTSVDTIDSTTRTEASAENLYSSTTESTSIGIIGSEPLLAAGIIVQSLTEPVQISSKLLLTIPPTANNGVEMSTAFVEQLSTEYVVQSTVQPSQSAMEPVVQMTKELVQSESIPDVRPSITKCRCRCTKPGQFNPATFSSMSFEAIMNLTPSVKKFSPEPVEAEGAKYVGASAIVILGCTFGFIIMMDLVSLSRHINLLRYNFNCTDINPMDSDGKKT